MQFLRLSARCLLPGGNPNIWWRTFSRYHHNNYDHDNDDYHYDYDHDHDNNYHTDHYDDPGTFGRRVGRLGPLEWVLRHLR